MKVLYIVNNYTLGTKVKSTQIDKIISRNRIDKAHTEIIYHFENIRQKESCDKILAKNGKIIENNAIETQFNSIVFRLRGH